MRSAAWHLKADLATVLASVTEEAPTTVEAPLLVIALVVPVATQEDVVDPEFLLAIFDLSLPAMVRLLWPDYSKTLQLPVPLLSLFFDCVESTFMRNFIGVS